MAVVYITDVHFQVFVFTAKRPGTRNTQLKGEKF